MISVVGLGKLGLPLATLHAQHTLVLGVDLSTQTVAAIRSKECPITESGVKDLLVRAIIQKSFHAYTDYAAVRDTDMTLVIVPSPSDETGAFSSEYVLDALYEIGKAIRGKTARHTVVICSTVMPGECQNSFLPVLVETSGKTIGVDLGLVYSPEFIALGSVVADMQRPDMIIIGESDPESGRLYEQLARKIIIPRVNHEINPRAHHMSLTSAEIAKISVNAYVTMKISFANTLGEVCQKTPGASATQIAAAIGADSRIGTKYLRPGVAFGGPCFPRDNRAFAVFGLDKGVRMVLAEATDQINGRQIDLMVDRIKEIGRRRVGILGLSYKPGTPITEEAFGLLLAAELSRLGYDVVVYDPLVRQQDGLLPGDVSWKHSPGDTVADDTVTVLCTPDPVFNIFPQVFSDEGKRNGLVLDCWGTIPEGPWDDTHIDRLGVSC